MVEMLVSLIRHEEILGFSTQKMELQLFVRKWLVQKVGVTGSLKPLESWKRFCVGKDDMLY